MLVENLPEIAYRENLQTASLMAAVLNMLGGKPDPNDKDTKLVPADRLYQPEEMLVYFAQRPIVSRWTPESARAAIEAKPNLPAWARDAIPWTDILPLVAEVKHG
jgi:hypothetical protein